MRKVFCKSSLNIKAKEKKQFYCLLPSSIFLLFIASIFILPSSFLFASFEDDASGARMKGLGGAFVSIADDSETIFVQPAGTLNIKRPEISVMYGKLYTGLSDGSDISDTVISAVYPVDRKLAVGFGYKSTGLSHVYTEETAALNVSMGVSKMWAAGLNLKYLTLRYGTDGYTRIDPVFSSGYDKSGIEADAGIFITPLKSLSFGYSRRNLFGTDMGLKSESRTVPRDRIGVSYRETGYGMSVESIKTGTRYKYVGSLEKYMLKDVCVLRFGMGWGENNYRKISTGLGINLNQFRIDYAWEIPLSGIEQTSGTHYLSFVMKVGSPGKTEPEAKAPENKKKPKKAKKADVPKKKAPEKPVFEEPIAPVFLPGMLMPLRPPVSLFLQQASTETIISTEAAKAPAEEPVISTSAAHGEEIAVSTEPAAALETEIATEPASLPVVTVPGTVYGPDPKPAPVVEAPKPVKEKPVKAAPPGVRTYKVVSGDTMMSLAEKYYGKKSQWVQIYQANKDKIEKGALKPGQMIIIP
ncbi:MAG: LysM peptidoglycan-binding domain-containing protein [Elusimicrobiota bacterium]